MSGLVDFGKEMVILPSFLLDQCEVFDVERKSTKTMVTPTWHEQALNYLLILAALGVLPTYSTTLTL